MNRHLHIVCPYAPWPQNHGMAIDIMNRIIALHDSGISLHLHYFCERESCHPTELNRYCESIHIYQKTTLKKSSTGGMPAVIVSHLSDDLVFRLQQDRHPILMEGIHCSGNLPRLISNERNIMVRMPYDASLHYKELARDEISWLKKIFFRNQSRRFRKYQHSLPKEVLYACITEQDRNRMQHEYHLPKTTYIPAFTAWQRLNSEEGIGSFCLYQADLSVAGNERAAMWLLQKVFSKIQKPFVIAGKNPSQKLLKQAHLFQHTCIVANPTSGEMNDLVRKAQILLLPSFQKSRTGMSMKLIHALCEGRHCVTNRAMTKNTGLQDACHIAESASAFASVILQLFHQPFTEEEIQLRRHLFAGRYQNETNAALIIEDLWSHYP